MPTTLFTGCSYTNGHGWELEHDDPNLWINILHSSNFYLQKTNKINLGIAGGSNAEIFYVTVSGILKYQPTYVLVEWTSYPRYNVMLSAETYSAKQSFIANAECFDHKLHDISYTKEYLTNIRDRFISLHHPHQGILEIVKYTNALIELCKTSDTKIFFINGICPWDDDYFKCLKNVLPSEYTKYTQSILNCNTRNDDEIFQLYYNIHSDYQEAGSIQQSHWLNLYNSLRSQLVDSNNDGIHPGKQSNIIYSDFINQALTSKLSS